MSIWTWFILDFIMTLSQCDLSAKYLTDSYTSSAFKEIIIFLNVEQCSMILHVDSATYWSISRESCYHLNNLWTGSFRDLSWTYLVTITNHTQCALIFIEARAHLDNL